MAEITPSNFTIMTNAGLDLATQLLGSKNRITAFRAVATDTAYYTADPETIAGLKAITPIKQEGIINDVHDESSNTSVITAAFNQKEIDSDYQLNTLGIFATDENKNEILYAVMCLQHPDYMAKVDTSDVMTYQTKIVVGNSQNVQISLAAADTVTMAQFNAQMAKMIDTDKLKQYLVDNNYADKTYVDTTIGQLPSQTISDTRDVDWTPKRYMDNGVKVTREFKSNKTLNLDDGGFGDTGFSELITDTPWGNSSGGFPFQIAKDTGTSKFFFRIGKSDDEWGAWTSLIPDLPSGLVSLSDDNVTVTATTKDGEQKGVWVTKVFLDNFKQSILDQAGQNAKTIADKAVNDELGTRNAPKHWWYGTQADFDKIDPKNVDWDYSIYEEG
ncbi:hypothetical protein [Secundilactobacillus kimchicus]|uniref:hypothetical protein n=1 Tax=Secundilactobacillus kimchicus TaxID=528209 RepID=UPI0024A92628|nr:hypothetical protein [Secundilactobacillus kimchicus]